MKRRTECKAVSQPVSPIAAAAFFADNQKQDRQKKERKTFAELSVCQTFPLLRCKVKVVQGIHKVLAATLSVCPHFYLNGLRCRRRQMD
jgi:hypothetical protein